MNGFLRSALFGFGLLALNFAAGCVYSKYPLTDAKASQPDLRLLGTWEVTDSSGGDTALLPSSFSLRTGKVANNTGEKPTLTITQKKDFPKLLVITEIKNGVERSDELLTTKIGNDYYISYPDPTDKEKTRFAIIKYELTDKGQIKFWAPSQEFFFDAVIQGEIKGKVEKPRKQGLLEMVLGRQPDNKNRNVFVDLTADELYELLEKNGAKCFDKEVAETLQVTQIKKGDSVP